MRMALTACVMAAASVAFGQCGPALTGRIGGGVAVTHTANSGTQVIGMGTRFAVVDVSNLPAANVVSSLELDSPVEAIADRSSLDFWVLTSSKIYEVETTSLSGPRILFQSALGPINLGQGVFAPELDGVRALAQKQQFQYVTGESGTYVLVEGQTRGWVPGRGQDLLVHDGRVWMATDIDVVQVTHTAMGQNANLVYGLPLMVQGVRQKVLGLGESGSTVYALTTSPTGTETTLWVLGADGNQLSVQASRTVPISGVMRARLTQSGSTLYICCGEAGTCYFNISAPNNPGYIGRVATEASDQSMSVHGTAGFIARGAGGMRIVDLSAGGAPATIGTMAIAPGHPLDVDVFADTYVVTANGLAGMTVLQADTTPLTPFVRGSLDFGAATRVSTTTFAAFFVTPTGITAVSYQNPATPVVAGIVTLPGQLPLDVLVFGQKLLVLSDTTLFCYDISGTYLNPPLLSSVTLQQPANPGAQMTLGQDRVYIASWDRVMAYSIAASTGALTYDRAVVMPAGEEVRQISSRVTGVPTAPDYLAVVTGKVTTGSANPRYEVQARLYGWRVVPLPRTLVQQGVWAITSELMVDELDEVHVPGASMNGTLLCVEVVDRVWYGDIANQGAPADLGSAPTGFAEGGGIRAGASAIYVGGGRGGLVTLKRQFSSEPSARGVFLSPITPACGDTAVLTASFAGAPTPSAYQWFDLITLQPVMDGVQGDGSVASGAGTAQLTISNLAAGVMRFRCDATNSCGTGSAVGDAYEVPACPAGCETDYNQDGNADQSDVAYLVDVVAGGPNPTGLDPDFTRDGNVDQDDIAALINVIAGGPCP